MKAIIRFGGFGGKLEIEGGEVVVSTRRSRESFSISLEEISHPQINQAVIRFGGGDLRIEMEQAGRVIIVGEGPYHPGKWSFTRFVRGSERTEEYLTKRGDWKQRSRGHGPPPDDILLIPIELPKIS